MQTTAARSKDTGSVTSPRSSVCATTTTGSRLSSSQSSRGTPSCATSRASECSTSAVAKAATSPNGRRATLHSMSASVRLMAPSALDFELTCGVATDIAEESVRQAHGRWQKRRDRTPTQVTQFYVLDCFGKSLDTIADGYFLQRNSFSHVSTQMALHYSFETPQKANMFFENVSNYLADGGYFVGTTLDAETLLGRLAEEQAERGPDVLEFGNAVYRVEFSSQDSPPDRFGHEYKFTLVDAVDAVPEYVVYWDLLVEYVFATRHDTLTLLTALTAGSQASTACSLNTTRNSRTSSLRRARKASSRSCCSA